MLLPAEIESKSLIPALRAILAKDLAKKHNIREDEISRLLGVTQAAVSNYIRGIRGDPKLIEKLLEEKQVASMITEITDNLASDNAYTPLSLSKFISSSLNLFFVIKFDLDFVSGAIFLLNFIKLHLLLPIYENDE